MAGESQNGLIIVKPFIGQEFMSEEMAYEYYNDYGGRMGFSIRREWMHVDSKTKKLVDRMICCSKEGFRSDDLRRINVKNRNQQTRCGCRASMVIRIDKEKDCYVVKRFTEAHNHQLQDPQCRFMIRSQRNFTTTQAVVATLGRESGLATRQVFEYMGTEVGGVENLGFMKDDMKRHLQTIREKSMAYGEAAMILDHFQEQSAKDPGFFSAYLLDTEEHITNIFWADSRMIDDYRNFGDTFGFDTTYRTNNLSRPCAVFTGLNHYRKTVIFGAALLYDETGESFEWLFRTFLQCMSDKKPQTIFTDQAQAIAVGLRNVMPDVKHCLCRWHLTQNLCTHYGRFQKDGIVVDWNNVMHTSMSKEQFEEVWKMFTLKWGVENDEWFKKKYELREKWVDAFLTETLTLGITSTQINERFNASLKQKLRADVNIIDFFILFDKVVKKRRLEELITDFKARHKCFDDKTMATPMLRQASEVYTLPIYEKFALQFETSWRLVTVGEFVKEGGTLYRVAAHEHEHNFFEVLGCRSSKSVTCSCAHYQMVGYLCSHAIKVLDRMDIKTIPPQYILKRWTKSGRDAPLAAANGSTRDVEPDRRMSQRYHSIVPKFVAIATRAAECEEATESVLQALDVLSERVRELCSQNAVDPAGPGGEKSSPEKIASDLGVRGIARKKGKKDGLDADTGGNKRKRGWYENCSNKRKKVLGKKSLAGVPLEDIAEFGHEQESDEGIGRSGPEEEILGDGVARNIFSQPTQESNEGSEILIDGEVGNENTGRNIRASYTTHESLYGNHQSHIFTGQGSSFTELLQSGGINSLDETL